MSIKPSKSYQAGYNKAIEEIEKIIDEWAKKKEGIYSYQEGIYDISLKDIKELKNNIKEKQ